MRLEIKGNSIYYEIVGAGEPLLLIHGWGGSSKSLSPISDLLSLKYKLISPDLPGFGLSAKPDPNWGVEEYALFLIEIIELFKLKPVVFFGHSFGGALGIYLAAKHPTYIKKLLLCGASFKRNPPATSEIGKLLGWLPTDVKKLAYRIFFPGSDLYKVPGLESNFRKIVSRDLTLLLPAIKTPTLILWGKNDIQTPVEQAAELHSKIKNSRLKIFPGIGHNLPLIYPGLVAGEMEKFL